MQYPERATVDREENALLNLLKKKRIPSNVEEFLSQQETNFTRNVFKLAPPARIANENDAEQIVKVNNNVYKGHYPYRDLLDVEYVREFASDANKGIIGVYDTIDSTREVGGFLMLSVNRDLRKGTFRGLMVDPRFRNKIHVKDRGFETVYEAYSKYYQDVELWFGETRTAHILGQKWMEECGSRPCAFLPNKDIFFGDGKRESDVLEIVFNQKALYQYRNAHPRLLPHFKSLYNHIAYYYDLPRVDFTTSNFSVSSTFLREAQQIADSCKLGKKQGKYGTYTLIIRTPHHSRLEFLVNESICTAEQAFLTTTNTLELGAMLVYLKSMMEHQHLDYFEIYIPAINVEQQQLFLDLGFSCFGYAPAWQREKNLLHDCLLFGLFRTPIDWNNTYLSDFSSALVGEIKPFLRVI
ncbi:MAG: hypothetical protein JW776_04825 [Candidatus Lokiarchaeota archaeon]|nr:hypothetical protein [Candidatus Lokiarchaeota archaeon]